MQKQIDSKDLFTLLGEQDHDAREFGFYWENIHQIIEQIRSECIEIEEAYQKGDEHHLREEIGDLLHASISLAIFCNANPSAALNQSYAKFQKRYDAVVALAKKDGHSHLKDQPYDLLISYWNKAKKMS